MNDKETYGGNAAGSGVILAPEEVFRKELSFERKRSERSRLRFVLMLVHAGDLFRAANSVVPLTAITKALAKTTRETDRSGWYKKDRVVGVICTDIGAENISGVLSALRTRVSSSLRASLSPEQMRLVEVTFHVFPDDLDLENGGRPADTRLYPDLIVEDHATKTARIIKRAIDVVGSAVAILLFSPFLVAIAVAIKLTSKGPILYKQQRMGQYGVRFTLWKFRSMHYKSDAKIHRDFVRQLIAAKGDQPPASSEDGVYKIKDDPRVTPVGRFLRKTSLDELPQFFNVLKGEMSLVGPRPPIPYEVEAYETWHRRRFLEVKPGITGLWQIEGRSRTKFDDMVRLDLKYAKTCSPWLDIKIILRTPWAVLRGHGAY
jgi:exopolysaccharide biosynthesis polyprenyl glycosylphosphotransferase